MANAGDRKRRTRISILESAFHCFTSKGFEAASIEEIMRDCDLTHGGFYAHFRSKSELYREAMGHALALGRLWDGVPASLESVNSLLRSPRLAFLAADLATEDAEVRAACSQVLRRLSERVLGTGAAESAKLSLGAMIVGAVAVAKSSDDRVFRARLAAACEEAAGALLGVARETSAPSFFWEPQPTT